MTLALLSLLACAEPPEPTPAENFVLLDTDGQARELFREGDREAVVLLSVEPGCSEPALSDLAPWAEALDGRRHTVWAVVGGDHSEREGLVQARGELAVPLLVDDSRTILASLGMTRAPEAVVVVPDPWRVVWQGPATESGLDRVLGALAGGEPMPRSAADDASCELSGPPERAVTYDQDVAPILQERCRVCHQRRGVAPFSMGSYGQVLGWGPMIREVLRTRRMPPWNADPTVGHFRHDLAITGDERRTLITWVEQGSPPGSGADPLAESRPPDRRPADAHDVAQDQRRREPDFHFEVPEQHIPSTGLLPYRYFDLGAVPEDLWVSGMRIEPSNTKVVHHACIIVSPHGLEDYGSVNRLKAAVHNDDDVERTHFWTPGRRFRRNWPDGFAFWMPEGHHLILEIHYNPSGRPEVDQPEVDLFLAEPDSDPTRIRVMYVQNREFAIPPRTRDFEVRATEVLEEDIVVTGLNVHLHYRGRAARLEATLPGEAPTTLISVPHYDFNWQRGYPPKEPIHLPAGTSLTSIGVFDNSGQNPLNPDPDRWVPWGTQTPINEMFKASITYHRPVED